MAKNGQNIQHCFNLKIGAETPLFSFIISKMIQGTTTEQKPSKMVLN
jgi:hypothetical protein